MINKNMKKLICNLFLICMNISFVLQLSQLYAVPIWNFIGKIFLTIGLFLLIFKTVADFKLSIQYIYIDILLVFTSIVTFISGEGLTIIKLFLFYYIIRDIEVKNVLKYFIISLLVSFIIVAITSFLSISDILYTERKVAYVFGMTNPNTFPVIFFAIITSYNILNFEFTKNYKYIYYKTILIEFLLLYLIYYLTKSRTSIIVISIYLFLLLIIKLSDDNRICTKIIKKLFFPFQLLFPICAGLSYYCAHFFNGYNNILGNINLYLSGRILSWQKYILEYPINFAGNNIEFKYGALDNAYLQIILKYGVIGFSIYTLMFILISRYAYKNNKLILMATLVAYQCYFIAEFGPLQINFCSVLMIFPYIMKYIGNK